MKKKNNLNKVILGGALIFMTASTVQATTMNGMKGEKSLTCGADKKMKRCADCTKTEMCSKCEARMKKKMEMEMMEEGKHKKGMSGCSGNGCPAKK